jgi:hypothetical protein
MSFALSLPNKDVGYNANKLSFFSVYLSMTFHVFEDASN